MRMVFCGFEWEWAVALGALFENGVPTGRMRWTAIEGAAIGGRDALYAVVKDQMRGDGWRRSAPLTTPAGDLNPGPPAYGARRYLSQFPSIVNRAMMTG